MQKMSAEILFTNLSMVILGGVELIRPGFHLEVLGWENSDEDEPPKVWVEASIESGLDTKAFFDWAADVVEKLGGELVEAGPASSRRSDWATNPIA